MELGEKNGGCRTPICNTVLWSFSPFSSLREVAVNTRSDSSFLGRRGEHPHPVSSDGQFSSIKFTKNEDDETSVDGLRTADRAITLELSGGFDSVTIG